MRAHLFEEHSSVLGHWWRERVRARTVVYFDAHLDLQYVSPERIGRLERCASAEAFAALEKPHDLCPDGGFAYSLENFLYPAARLGMMKRLIWVAPPHVATRYSQGVLDQLRQMEGVGRADLDSFRPVDGRIEGRLLGLEIALCDLGGLERVPLPADSLLDVDVDYFVAVPGDRAWLDPREVLGVLRRLRVATDSLTISRSVTSGFTPLRHRFLGDYLAALWEDRPEESEHYSRLFRLERELAAGGRESALQGFAAEAERWPECAATWHLLGLAHADAAQAARCHARAVAIAPAYAPSLLRSACEVRHRRLAADRAFMMRLEPQLAQVPQGERGAAFAALGLLWCGFGELARAAECYQRAAALLGSQSDLAMQLAKLYLRAGKTDAAVQLLTAALEDDKARCAAHGYLGHVLLRSGRLAEARSHLEQAHQAAPCWPEPLEALGDLYRQLGEQGLAARAAERLAEARAAGRR